MYNILLKNYWLSRIDTRKKEQHKQNRLNGIVDKVMRKIKLSRDKDNGNKKS